MYRWAIEALEGLLRLTHPKTVAGPEVEVLSLATMRWVAGGVPSLPAARTEHVVVALGDGRV